jgi:hypothetical protein
MASRWWHSSPGKGPCASLIGSRAESSASTFRSRASTTLLVLGCVGILGISAPTRADPVVPEARIESARGVAMGTGSRASSASTQAQADNPANLAGPGVAHAESTFGYQPQLKAYAVGASVVDAMTSSHIAAGLSSRFLFGDNSAGENSGWEGRLGLGVPIGQMISLGIAGRYSNFTVSNPHAKPERPPEDEFEEPDRTFKLKAFTMDAAITLRLFEGFAISAIGTNLIDTGTPLAPLLVGGSAAFGGNGFSLGGDVLVDLNLHDAFNGAKLLMGGGLEYLTQGLVPVRIGYTYDQGRRTHSISGGLGYLAQRFGIQFSMRQMLNGAHKDSTIFATIQYFVQ